MATIKVYKDGRELTTLSLDEGREYIAGRSDTADIRLQDQSTSRQHLKIFFVEGAWQVQITSRFGSLIHAGQEHQSLSLENGMSFQTSGYEFKFEEKKQPVAPAPSKANLPARSNSNAPAVSAEGSADAEAPIELEVEEKTSIMTIVGQGHLKIYNSATEKSKTYKLDGQLWRIGRSPECQIVIDEGAASRNHFEIYKTSAGFQIKDLASSNGTALNGRILEEKIPYPLNSGDVITIGGTTIEFEVRDPQFEERLKEIALFSGSPGLPAMGGRGVERITPQRRFTPQQMRIGIGGFIFLMLVIALSGEDQSGQAEIGSEEKTVAGAPTPPPDDMSRLDQKQKQLIKDTYNLADSLYKRGKHEAALIEIRKIHELVPFFKNSRELEVFCQQAIDIQVQQNEIEIAKQKEQAIRNQVRDIVEECRRRHGTSGAVSTMESCLAGAFELDPENGPARSLLATVEKNQRDREAKAVNNEAYESALRQSQQMYSRARELESKKQWLDAIAAYNKFLQSTLPDPKNNKAKAKASIAQIRKAIDKEIDNRQQDASELFVKEKHKEALETLEEALELDPANPEAKNLYDKIYNDLRKRLKALYDDSVLEESLGNIEAAKQKWETIISQDLKDGEYYQKAKRKTKKYGN